MLENDFYKYEVSIQNIKFITYMTDEELKLSAGYAVDFPGIDIVKFGENISIIQKRTTTEKTSVLDVYEKTLAVFRDYYQNISIT